jgi:Helix-turn-helix.
VYHLRFTKVIFTKVNMIERIKEVMEVKQLSPAQFADLLEINRSNLTHLFSGRNQPSLDFARKILKRFPDIKTEWLIMGVGPMFQDEPVYKERAQAKTLDLFTDYSEMDEKIEVSTEDSSPTIESDEETAQDTDIELSMVKKEIQKTRTSKRITSSELKNVSKGTEGKKILHSQEDKKVEKIVFFYSDNTFETYYPQ